MKPFEWPRQRLQSRIIVLVGIGMLALGGILAVSMLNQGRELMQRTLVDRQRLAEAMADHFDYVLKSNLVALQNAAEAVHVMESRTGAVKAAVRQAYVRSIFSEGVALLDRSGRLIWAEPEQPSRSYERLIEEPAVRQAIEEGKPQVSNLSREGGSTIYAAVPVRDFRGEVIGAVVGALDPKSQRFRSLLQPVYPGAAAYVDLVDGNGIVLASTRAGGAFTESDHGRILSNLIRQKKSFVGGCHDCHEEKGFPERKRQVIAFAPLGFAPWGVAIRQAEKEVLAPASAMEHRLALVGSLTIFVALLFAWGVSRSVTKPLGVLTRAAERIAAGDLEEPIPPLGEDEIGNLAGSFDQMRAKLKTLVETIAKGSRVLERRVQERTRELQGLYQELQRKEAVRGELLKKAIVAQEEERKRIARELHDETSQASAALLLSIEACAKAAPDPLQEELHRMRAMGDRILDSIHRLIFDLRPSMLDDLGLPAALRSAAEGRLEPMGIDLSFEVVGSERRLAPEIETTLFRIGQEAISNIARHAEAGSVHIRVDFSDERAVELQVQDDGKGFEPKELSEVKGARGLGLLGMKERAALLGGTLTIESEPGNGTCVSARIPLSETPSHGAQP